MKVIRQVAFYVVKAVEIYRLLSYRHCQTPAPPGIQAVFYLPDYKTRVANLKRFIYQDLL